MVAPLSFDSKQGGYQLMEGHTCQGVVDEHVEVIGDGVPSIWQNGGSSNVAYVGVGAVAEKH